MEQRLSKYKRGEYKMFNVNHVTISVRDNIRSIEFYKKFGFKILKSWQADDNSIKIDTLKLNNII